MAIEPDTTPRRRRSWLVVSASVLAATGIAIGGVFTYKAVSEPTPPVAAASFTMYGSIEIQNGYPGTVEETGWGCHGRRGFSDIVAGAAVIITDSKWQTLGTGSLDEGQKIYADTPAILGGPTRFVASCKMAFRVHDLPPGRGQYSVTISHRGTQVVDESQARSAAGVQLVLSAN